jgi:hypothetical protein
VFHSAQNNVAVRGASEEMTPVDESLSNITIHRLSDEACSWQSKWEQLNEDFAEMNGQYVEVQNDCLVLRTSGRKGML